MGGQPAARRLLPAVPAGGRPRIARRAAGRAHHRRGVRSLAGRAPQGPARRPLPRGAGRLARRRPGRCLLDARRLEGGAPAVGRRAGGRRRGRHRRRGARGPQPRRAHLGRSRGHRGRGRPARPPALRRLPAGRARPGRRAHVAACRLRPHELRHERGRSGLAPHAARRAQRHGLAAVRRAARAGRRQGLQRVPELAPSARVAALPLPAHARRLRTVPQRDWRQALQPALLRQLGPARAPHPLRVQLAVPARIDQGLH